MKDKLNVTQDLMNVTKIWELYKAKRIELSPRFQRRRVWQKSGKAYFVDTLMRGLPVPKIYVRMMLQRGQQIFEVVDGQQRLATIIEFLQDKLAVSGTHNDEYGGRVFSDLPVEERDRFLSYKISVDVLENVSDRTVLEIFARLNSYNIVLNSQEKRNAWWFGEFKTVCTELAQEALEFWRENRILSDGQILRMAEIELTSELLIAIMDGLQDKKKSIDKFYERYDKDFPKKNHFVRLFRSNIDLTSYVMGDSLKSSNFRRRALFYSLFCALYDVSVGLPMSELKAPGVKESDMKGARERLIKLSDILNADEPSKKYVAFIEACARQTDNVTPRKIRHDFIVSAILGR